MINLVTVNYNSYDFLALLIESIEITIESDYHIIVVDNSDEKQRIDYNKCTVIKSSTNIGHGAGLNEGIKHAIPEFSYIMFLDVDVHFLQKKWDQEFLINIRDSDVIAARGVVEKPIRPACMFIKQNIAKQYDWNSTPGYKGVRGGVPGYDVAINAYHQMIENEVKIKFMNSYSNKYETLTGEEWGFASPLVYHHWSGTWLKKRQEDFPNDDLFVEKEKLFNKIPWRQI